MRRFFFFAAIAAVAFGAIACGGSDAARVTIDAVASPTARARPPGGAKLGSAIATPRATASTAAAASTPTPAPDPSATPLPAEPTAAAPPAEIPVPETGRWIDVDVTNYVVRLMDGAAVVREIGPVGVGAQVDTGEYLSTQTGLFYVNGKAPDLTYDAPFDTYISHWVGFDADKDNGFHSFLKDAKEAVVDASTGRVSNGCIRTGEPEAIFDFAEIGMPVRVHW